MIRRFFIFVSLWVVCFTIGFGYAKKNYIPPSAAVIASLLIIYNATRTKETLSQQTAFSKRCDLFLDSASLTFTIANIHKNMLSYSFDFSIRENTIASSSVTNTTTSRLTLFPDIDNKWECQGYRGKFKFNAGAKTVKVTFWKPWYKWLF